ncbi:MAG: glycerol-3-phosphate dehydrogenase [Parasphingorhabdus sp.]|jgi:glycerol-3-phosphate dehydrogenase
MRVGNPGRSILNQSTERIKQSEFDVIVIGGGIHGAVMFYDLAKAGYRVLLLEQGDFGHATSSNSLKVLHGGIRYLQHGNIKRMRESIRSRSTFMRLMPHLIQPQAFLMPTMGLGLKSRWLMAIAIMLNDLVGWDRNCGVPKNKKLARGKIFSRHKLRAILEDVTDADITGAACWYDAVALDSERIVLEFIKRGKALGGQALNYVAADSLIRSNDCITGVRAQDKQLGRCYTFSSQMVVNAMGPCAAKLLQLEALTTPGRTVARAVNLVINRQWFGDFGIGLEGSAEFSDADALVKRRGRLYFFVPWQGKTLVGTSYQFVADDSDSRDASEIDCQNIIDEINQIHPTASLQRSDVLYAHAGLVPAYSAVPDSTAEPQLVKHSEVIDHSRVDNIQGLVSVNGVKFTTAPSVSRTVLKLLDKVNIQPQSNIKRPNIPGSKSKPDELTKYPHLQERYGDDYWRVMLLINQQTEQNLWICQQPPLLLAEVTYCIQDEFALHLEDIIFRRTPMAAMGPLDPDVVACVANIMASELGWDASVLKSEIESVWRLQASRLG